MARKKIISEAERQRRARQAAEQAGAGGGSKTVDPALRDPTRPGHASTLAAKHVKKTGRGS